MNPEILCLFLLPSLCQIYCSNFILQDLTHLKWKKQNWLQFRNPSFWLFVASFMQIHKLLRTFQLFIAENDCTSVFLFKVLYVLIKHTAHTVVKKDEKKRKVSNENITAVVKQAKNVEAMCGGPQVIILLDHL